MSGVTVVGSSNVDLTISVRRLPLPGETVLGSNHVRMLGGKGANQAVAAARLGQRVELVARIGDDDFAAMVRDGMRQEGVGTSHLWTTTGAPTGVALITVDEEGENTIAVSPGANSLLSPSDVAAASDVIAAAGVVLVQLEIRLETVAAATAVARGTVVLNPAPATAIPDAIWERVDVVVPNRSELVRLTGGGEAADDAELVDRARTLPPPLVVVTLGAAGVVVVAGGEVHRHAAVDVTAVDTTGAGDAFCGALADALARGAAIDQAAGWANRVAALATTAHGAQSALPRRQEVSH